MGCRSSKVAVREPGAKPQAPQPRLPGEGEAAATLGHNGMKHGYSAAAAATTAVAASVAPEDAADAFAPIAQTVSHVLGRIVGSLMLDEEEGTGTQHAGVHSSAASPSPAAARGVPAGQCAGQSVGSGDF